MVLYPGEFRLSRSLRRTIRRGIFEITFDHAFDQVIRACGRLRVARGEGTWITSEMVDAYCRLHQLGYAHSVEAWHTDRLVGGLYGVALGRAFFGESMFAAMTDASKVSLARLVQFLIDHRFELVDCQMPTGHLARLGARNIPRKAFLKQLEHALKHPGLQGIWGR